MSWSELIKHPYITVDPRSEKQEDELHLSYSNYHGQYVRDDSKGGSGQMIDESTMLGMDQPHKYLNEKNAIILNCRNPFKF